jgi:hypothetical protein
MFRLLVFLIVLACCAIPASATLTTYTDLPSFTAATTNQTFQNIAIPSGNDGTSYTDPTTGIEFSDSTGLIGVTAPGGWPSDSSLEANHCGSNSGCTLTITLPTAVTSVSLYAGLSGYNAFEVTVSNGVDAPFSSNQEQSSLSTPLFYGFVSTTPFTTFTIATEDNVNNLFLDNIEAGTSGGGGGGGDAQTPEAATFLMIGSGLVMLHFGRRWLPRAS